VNNTPIGRQAAHDDRYLCRAPVEAIAALRSEQELVALQGIHRPWRS